MPLRSSWPKGKYRNYAHYLCQTKSCSAYGKSIPRDKLEDEVGQLIKSFEPNRILLGLVSDLFKSAWQQRTQQAAHAINSAKSQIKALEKQTEALLERIMDASNDSVINAYEAKIAKLERDKLKLQENIAIRTIPDNTLKEKLELSLQFFASPWKIWEKGQITLRRAVLRLAFEDRLAYHRIEGARTPKLSLPFKTLRGKNNHEVLFGAAEMKN